MKRSPIKKKRPTKRRVTSPRCKNRQCNKPAKVAGYCVSHGEREADRLFSLWVRDRDQFCKARHVLQGDCKGPLQAAHLVGRRNHTLRYDPRNVHGLCAAHHMTIDQHGQEGAKLLVGVHLLGGDRYNDMMFESLRITDRNASIEAALERLASQQEGAG